MNYSKLNLHLGIFSNKGAMYEASSNLPTTRNMSYAKVKADQLFECMIKFK
jgi:hypothetical protein